MDVLIDEVVKVVVLLVEDMNVLVDEVVAVVVLLIVLVDDL